MVGNVPLLPLFAIRHPSYITQAHPKPPNPMYSLYTKHTKHVFRVKYFHFFLRERSRENTLFRPKTPFFPVNAHLFSYFCRGPISILSLMKNRSPYKYLFQWKL